MSWLPSLWHRVVALVNRRAVEREMEEEMAFHLAAAKAVGIRDGLTPQEASDGLGRSSVEWIASRRRSATSAG